MFSSEVLPAPLGPMIETMLPRGTSSETSCDGRTPPNFFDTPFDHELVVALRRATARWADAPAMNPPYSTSCCAYRWRHHAGSDGRRQQIRLDFRHRPPGDADMPRHIVCLTFDHDHMSGFIARGMTSPTAISRGEYDMVVIPRLVALLAATTSRRRSSRPATRSTARPQAVDALCRGRPRARPSRLDPSPARHACRARRKKRRSCAATSRSSASAASTRAATARPPGTSRPTPSSCC